MHASLLIMSLSKTHCVFNININLYYCLIFFLQDRIIPTDPIAGSEKLKTLKRLDQVIQQRLVTSKLPPQMSNLVIGTVRVGLLYIHRIHAIQPIFSFTFIEYGQCHSNEIIPMMHFQLYP